MATFSEAEQNDDVASLNTIFDQAKANRSLVDIFAIFRANYPPDLSVDDRCYAESRAFIKYLYTTVGQARFQQFIGAVTTDGDLAMASETAFGADLTTLENNWKATYSLPQTPRPAAATPVPVPTTPYTPGQLQGRPNQTRPFAISGGQDLVGTILFRTVGSWLLILLAIVMNWRFMRRPGATPLAPILWREQAVLALSLPLAVGIGALWTRLDPAASWQRDLIVTAIASALLAIGGAVLTAFAADRRRRILTHTVTTIFLFWQALALATSATAAGVSQGLAYEQAGAYALADRTLQAARATPAERAHNQYAWYMAAKDAHDDDAAIMHLRAAITLDPAGSLASMWQSTLSSYITDEDARLVGAHQFSHAVQLDAAQLASSTCDSRCQQAVRAAESDAYLAWANDQVAHNDVSGAFTTLNATIKALPGSPAATSAQLVIAQHLAGLAGVLKAQQQHDVTAMELLLELIAVEHPGTDAAIRATSFAQPVSGQTNLAFTNYDTNHMYFIAFASEQEVQTFWTDYYHDTSLFKITTVANRQGVFATSLPAGYFYTPIWEVLGPVNQPGYIHIAKIVITVQPFTPIVNISLP